MNSQWKHRITPFEAVGLRPLGTSLKQCWKALAGDAHSPPSRWGPTALKIFTPRLGVRTWLGKSEPDRRIPIINYFNHALAPRDEGYDVRVTQVRDYRGKRMTYNSHNGTDFAVCVGTNVVAPASGVVRVVENLMYRGGLKVLIDHGDGLMTICCHLSRALVEPGSSVGRGQPIGLSGYSGIDGIVSFPFIPPHVHFTVMHNGEQVDPFDFDGTGSLWRGADEPRAVSQPEAPPLAAETCWNVDAVDRFIDSCRDDRLRVSLASIRDPQQRGALAAYWRIFRYTAFAEHPNLVERPYSRTGRLDLPFSADEFIGCYPARD